MFIIVIGTFGFMNVPQASSLTIHFTNSQLLFNNYIIFNFKNIFARTSPKRTTKIYNNNNNNNNNNNEKKGL